MAAATTALLLISLYLLLSIHVTRSADSFRLACGYNASNNPKNATVGESFSLTCVANQPFDECR